MGHGWYVRAERVHEDVVTFHPLHSVVDESTTSIVRR